jgi:hypothetical protein
MTPFPHLAGQSVSFVLLQVEGQQSSPEAQVVCCLSFTHSAVQLPGLTSFLSWQRIAGQAVGQLASGSQVSDPSLTPLSHLVAQSLSVVALQPGGQHPSLALQVVSGAISMHRAVHVAAEPSIMKRAHARFGQLDGQLPGGSHCSPVSIAEFPQTAAGVI